MERNSIKKLVTDQIATSKRDALYTTKNSTYHTHNNIDSPILALTSMGGFPNSYTGSAGKLLAVNSTQTGVTFFPTSFSGASGKAVIVNSNATGFTFGAKVGGSGPLFDYFTDVNNSTTSETDLYSSTLAAGQLATNGDKIWARYQGTFTGAVGATQELRTYFGGTVVYDSGALSIGAVTDNWTLEILAIRVSASVVRTSVSVSSDFATLFPYSTYAQVSGLTLTNTQILKITGQAAGAGAASNQVTAKLGAVSYQVAA